MPGHDELPLEVLAEVLAGVLVCACGLRDALEITASPTPIFVSMERDYFI